MAGVIVRRLAFQASGLNEQVEWAGFGGKGVHQTPGVIRLYGRTVLCKNMRPLSKAFQPTGLSVFPKYGIEFVSDGMECVSQDHQLSREEAFVHAVALNELDNRTLGFCMLFLLKNKNLGLKAVERLARYFKCEDTVCRMVGLYKKGAVSEKNALEIDYWRAVKYEPIQFATVA